MKKSPILAILFILVILFYSCESSSSNEHKDDIDVNFVKGTGITVIIELDSVDPTNGKKRPKPPTESGQGN